MGLSYAFDVVLLVVKGPPPLKKATKDGTILAPDLYFGKWAKGILVNSKCYNIGDHILISLSFLPADCCGIIEHGCWYYNGSYIGLLVYWLH
jgi:hypothetical protein